MQTRELAKLGRPVWVTGLGTWQLGSDWGSVDEELPAELVDAVRTLYDRAIRPQVHHRW